MRENGIDEVPTHHAPDVLSFDVFGPVRNAGSDAIRRRAERWLSSYEGPVGYEVRDLSVTRARRSPSATISTGSAGAPARVILTAGEQPVALDGLFVRQVFEKEFRVADEGWDARRPTL